MPIDRLLKDKRTPEEVELLNKAFGVRLSFNNRLIGIVPPLSRRKQNQTPSYSTGFPFTAAELRKEH